MSSKHVKPVAKASMVKPSDIPVQGRDIGVLLGKKIGAAPTIDQSVILKTKKSLILPEDIPLAEAVKMDLVHPPKYLTGKGGKRLRVGPVPAGLGVFAKFSVQIIDAKGSELLARAKSPADRARIIARYAVRFPDPKTGKMVKKIEGPSHSFTRNMGFFVRGFLQNLDATVNLNETLTDDAGNPFLCRLKTPNVGSIAIVSGLAKIKFGNSNVALSTTQFNLQGVLLGPVTEAAVAVVLVVEDSVNTIFTVTGQILNGTGGVFNVEEVGLFPELGSQPGVANNTTMFLRDLTGTVPVNNGQTIIGQYTFTIAV